MKLCGIPDPPTDKTSQCKQSDIDRLFIQANFEGKGGGASDTKKAEQDANADRALVRFEFVEIIVRMALAKFSRNVRFAARVHVLRY